MTLDTQNLADLIDGRLPDYIDAENFLENAEERGESIKLYRDYVDGQQRNYMSSAMRNILNIPTSQPEGRGRGLRAPVEFSVNYCGKIVDALTDRLIVEKIMGTSDTDDASLNQWIHDVLQTSRFDGLQGRVHDAAVGDGEAFVGIEYDEETGLPILSVQPVYDGGDGIIALVDQRQHVLMAIKIWRLAPEDNEDNEDTQVITRINVYFPDCIESYITKGDSGAIIPLAQNPDDPMSFKQDWPVGIVPFVAFSNKLKAHTTSGLSEIADVIPLQDALNRTLYSMIAAAELTGFGIYNSFGCEFPAMLRPGTCNIIVDNEIVYLPKRVGEVEVHEPRIEKMQAETPTSYVTVADWLIEQIATITDTPLPQLMGNSTASGEALKQRESGLLGKAREAQVGFGNSWENVIAIAWEMQDTFGNAPPPPMSLTTVWRNIELRNDAETMAIVTSLYKEGIYDRRAALEDAAAILGWDSGRIDLIMERMEASQEQQLVNLINSPFGGLG